VSILTKFLTIANVSPIKSRPNLKVTNVAEVDSKNWLVTVENTGNRFGSLSSTSWEFESRDQLINSKVLSVNEVNQFVQQTLVPPKSKLLISLPRIEGFKAVDKEGVDNKYKFIARHHLSVVTQCCGSVSNSI